MLGIEKNGILGVLIRCGQYKNSTPLWSQPMILTLDSYKELFKDEASYRSFLAAFQKAFTQHGMPLVLANNEILFTALSPESTKTLLCDRILKRLSESPELLTELKERLEDPIVE
jgi:hypothetical protein